MLYTILKHLHSVNRWFFLAFVLASIIVAFRYIKNNNPSAEKLYKVAFIFTHVQLLLGLLLYVVSPRVIFSGDSMSDRVMRFYLVEHAMLMVIAILLISISYLKYKKQPDTLKSHKRIFWNYLIALFFVFAGIPWPFMPLGGAWF